MRGVLSAECRWLLWAVEYDTSRYQGPPRALPETDIKQDLGEGRRVTAGTYIKQGRGGEGRRVTAGTDRGEGNRGTDINQERGGG